MSRASGCSGTIIGAGDVAGRFNDNGSCPAQATSACGGDKIIKHQQGMYEAPTGSGKTVTCIGFIAAKQPRRTLILVDQLDLLNQWRKELAQLARRQHR